MAAKNDKKTKSGEESKAIHVGGVNESLGGVDPKIDENLERLSGGP